MSDATITTPTGWRITGSAETVQAISTNGLSAPGHVDWGVHLNLKSRSSQSPATEVLAGISMALSEQRREEIHLTLDAPLEIEGEDRYSGLRWEPAGTGAARGGELLYRIAHPLRRVPCIVRVILQEFIGRTSLTVVIGAAEGGLQPGVDVQALRPRWLDALHERVTATCEGRVVDAHPLQPQDIAAFVERTILSAQRTIPVMVVSPREDGTFVIPPRQLAHELAGWAHVYSMPEHTTSFVLTDTLQDKRWSAFWGAVRIYLPGLSLNDDPASHPLLLPDRLEDAYVRATILGRLPLPDLHLPEQEVDDSDSPADSSTRAAVGTSGGTTPADTPSVSPPRTAPLPTPPPQRPRRPAARRRP